MSKIDWADLPDFPLNLLKETHPRHISGTFSKIDLQCSGVAMFIGHLLLLSRTYRILQVLHVNLQYCAFLGTDDQVQVKFLELLSEHFHPVHSVPDIHFLKDEKQRLSDSDNDDDVEWASGMHFCTHIQQPISDLYMPQYT